MASLNGNAPKHSPLPPVASRTRRRPAPQHQKMHQSMSFDAELDRLDMGESSTAITTATASSNSSSRRTGARMDPVQSSARPQDAGLPIYHTPPIDTNQRQRRKHNQRSPYPTATANASSSRALFQHNRSFDSPWASPCYDDSNGEQRQRRGPQPLVLDPHHRTPNSYHNYYYGNNSPSLFETNGRQQKQGHNSHLPGVGKMLEAATIGRMRNSVSTVNTALSSSNNHLHASPAVIRGGGSSATSTAADFARTAAQVGYLQKLGVNIPEFKRRFFVLKPETNVYYYVSPNDVEPRGRIDVEGAQVTPLESCDQPSDDRFRFQISWPNDHDEQRQAVTLEARSKEVGDEWIQQLTTLSVSRMQSEVEELETAGRKQKQVIQDLERQIDTYRHMEKDRDGALEDAQIWKTQFEQLDEALRILTRQIYASHDGTKEEKKEEEDDFIGSPNRTDPLDTRTTDDVSFSSALDMSELEMPCSRYFAPLSNACSQQRESLRLLSEEAAIAVDDVLVAHDKVAVMEKSKEKTEKHINELWEENCTMRKKLKENKREKRVLVKEVKALQQLTSKMETAVSNGHPSMPDNAFGIENDPAPTTADSEYTDQLISELEDHVSASILLNQSQLDGVVGSIVVRRTADQQPSTSDDRPIAPNTENDQTRVQKKQSIPDLYADGDSVCSETDDSDVGVNDYPPVEDSCGSVGSVSVSTAAFARRFSGSTAATSEVTGPVVKKSLPFVSQNCATARLSCPLSDLVGTTPRDLNTNVYHLTFYSRKIGIQFQKAPPDSTKRRGILTAAMQMDIGDESTGNSDLKGLTEISSLVNRSFEQEEVCPLATPKDIVLVCGLTGFQESEVNKRPELGARLVAFDGISIETGTWTFKGVHQAIRARGRPLTLTFRNDILNPEQRAILTRALVDVNHGHSNSNSEMISSISRSQSGAASLNNLMVDGAADCHDSSNSERKCIPRVLNTALATPETVSSNCCKQKLAYATTKVALSYERVQGTISHSVSSYASSSNSVVSERGAHPAAIQRVPSNALNQYDFDDDAQPKYFQRTAVSVSESPQHLDYQANLL